MEAAMGSFNRSHAFDPLDLEIIDLGYEVASEQVCAGEPASDASEDPASDASEDEERQDFLRKRVFALAGDGGVDFDILLDRVLASLPKTLAQPRLKETPRS
jgi:hypothetical protein